MMRRLAPLLGGIAAVGVVFPIVSGVQGGRLLIVEPLFALLGVVALVVARRPATVESGWSGTARASGAADVLPVTRSVAHPSARQVAGALARVEARELASSPWFGVGIGFLVLTYVVFTVIYNDSGSHWASVVALAPWLAHPMVGMVVLAAHRGATRDRRDGADELFDACPTSPLTRTWGSLGSAWVPVAALVAYFAAYGATVAVRSPDLAGSPGADSVPVVLGALGLGIGSVALGVALGHWVRFVLAPVVAVVAVGFLSLKLATIGDPGWNPLQQLATLPPLSSQPPIFTDSPAWSHLGWVLALCAGVVVLAMTRHRRDRGVAVAGAVVAALLVATGVAATRPMPGPAATRLAARISDPVGHQICRSARTVQVCAYPGYERLVSGVVAEVTPVAAAVPAGTTPFALRQRFPGTRKDLPPEVARLLPDGVPSVPSGEAQLGFDPKHGARFLTALHAVDAPVDLGPDHQPVVLAGQARGVVALWLASRGLGPGAAARLVGGRTAHNGQPGPEALDAFDRGYNWPRDCGAPVVWSAQDLAAARVLIALPEAFVQAAVHRGWDRWKDPTTGTDDLLTALGLRPEGTFEAVQSRHENAC